jgi:hypothetical protein
MRYFSSIIYSVVQSGLEGCISQVGVHSRVVVVLGPQSGNISNIGR